jgi:anthranilate phosphoribosyltransferase
LGVNLTAASEKVQAAVQEVGITFLSFQRMDAQIGFLIE